jgi:hypothetical protein
MAIENKTPLLYAIGSKRTKSYTWKHKYTGKLVEVYANSENFSGKLAMSYLKEHGEDNEITLIKVKPLNHKED